MTISALKNRLNQAVQRLQHHPPTIGQPELMEQAAKRLLAGAGSGTAGGGTDRVHKALLALRQHGASGARQHLRYICWGLTERFPAEPLLCQPQFQDVLTLIRHAVAAGEFTLNPWLGLLQGYFRAKPEEIDGPAQQNWLDLRSFLASTLAAIRQRARAVPPWLATLTEHDNLLGDRPCERYARMLLKGEASRLDRLRDDIGIPPDSWFWREAVLAQVRAACDLANEPFKTAIPMVLDALANHSTLSNEALISLLPRYHRSFANSPHQKLQDYAVKNWGSPDISSQQRWLQVPPEVKGMILKWLAREDLETFFEVLQEDRTVDRRRFDFWLRYHGQMSYVRIALGPQPWSSSNIDLKQMRERRGDRVCRLEGGQGNLNAIIMNIRDHFFVEFSHTGNAAFGYAGHQVRFSLDRRQVPLWALKIQSSADHAFREPHVDSRAETWEQKYERILADQLGIFPDPDRQPLTRSGTPRPTIVAHTGTARMPPTAPAASAGLLDMTRLQNYCRQMGLRMDDRRAKGGAVWVHYDGEAESMARELKAMGFQFSRGNGWWRK